MKVIGYLLLNCTDEKVVQHCSLLMDLSSRLFLWSMKPILPHQEMWILLVPRCPWLVNSLCTCFPPNYLSILFTFHLSHCCFLCFILSWLPMRHCFLRIQTSHTSLIEERISQTASLGLEDQSSLSNPEAPGPLDDLEMIFLNCWKKILRHLFL